MNNIIAPKLVGMDATDQKGIDKLMVEAHVLVTCADMRVCGPWLV